MVHLGFYRLRNSMMRKMFWLFVVEKLLKIKYELKRDYIEKKKDST